MIKSALLFSLLFLLFSLAGYTQDVEELIQKGIQKSLIKNYAGAIEDFTKAIQIDPKCAKAYANRGGTKSFIKDYQGSIIDLNQSIKLGRENNPIYYSRGICKYILGDYYGAISDFTKALEFDPTDQFSNKFRENARLKLNEKLSNDPRAKEKVQTTTQYQKEEAKNNSNTSTLISKDTDIYSLQNGGAALREMPDTKSRALLILPQGSEVIVLSTIKNFFKVNSYGTVGYINKFLLTKGSYTGKILPISSSINNESNINKVYSKVYPYKLKLESDCNIVDKPEIAGNIIGKMTEGSEVDVLAKIDDFYKVNYEGEIRFINKMFFGEYINSNGRGNYASQTNNTSAVKYPSLNPTDDEEEQKLDKWLNESKEHLIKRNGPPAKISTDGKGGEIYTYEVTYTTTIAEGSSYTIHNDGKYVLPQYKDVTFDTPATRRQVTHSNMFFIDKDGIIYYWLIKDR